MSGCITTVSGRPSLRSRGRRNLKGADEIMAGEKSKTKPEKVNNTAYPHSIYWWRFISAC